MAKAFIPRRRKQRQVPILVVEDNADQWLIIRACLVQCLPEVEPIWMNNKDQAIAFLSDNAQNDSKLPRMILSDLYLPRHEDGWFLLDFIKNHSFIRKPPVILFSSSRDHRDIEKAYLFNAASYIVKPETHHQWLNCFYTFRRYWWEVASLPLGPLSSDS